MAVSWKCNKCLSSNSPVCTECKICAYKPNNVLKLCLQSIELHQDLIFHGYFRVNISNSRNTPKDIIQLCFEFYFVNLELPHTESSNDKQLDGLWRMADTFCYKHDNFIAMDIH